jgi:O-glycosyl hydrolase
MLALVLLGAMLSRGGAATDGPGDDRPGGQQVVRVDPEQRFQKIEGFGASGAWWTNYGADFPKAKRDEMLRLLFTDAGADLSIYRYNLPAGDGEEIVRPMRRTVLVETGPREYDFDRDWKAQRILEEVRALGVERFVLFAKSPPPRMLINGKVSGGPEGGSNLRPDMREDFAHYLLDLTEYLTRRYDLPHVVLSPINEPQWKWGREWRSQEGSHFTPAELAATLRVLLDTARERGFDLEIEAPESGDWRSARGYAEAMFSDPVIAERVRTFAVHSYWSNLREKKEFAVWFEASYPDKVLAMTEYCQMEHGHDLSIEGGLHLANVMHDDLVEAGVVSWQWWLGVFSGGYKDALIYAHPETQEIEPTRRLWVMGNYSRFVRPGAVRVGVEHEGNPDLRVSSFLAADGASLAVVIINNGAETVIQPQIKGGAIASMQAFVTSAQQDLSPVRDVAPYQVRLPAQSVTTLVVPLE